jgi:hypothetical protein
MNTANAMIEILIAAGYTVVVGDLVSEASSSFHPLSWSIRSLEDGRVVVHAWETNWTRGVRFGQIDELPASDICWDSFYIASMAFCDITGRYRSADARRAA